LDLTFFCKRGWHADCPGEWPVTDAYGPTHDCSFDIKMAKCLCECHSTIKQSTTVQHSILGANKKSWKW